jgi:hypothetical protein
MQDPKTPPMPDALTPGAFRAAHARARRYAAACTGSRATADELLSRALSCAFAQGESRWDPLSQPDLARHLLAVLDRLHGRGRSQVDPAVASRILDEASTALRRAGHDRALAVVALWRHGVDAPADQAQALACTVEEIRLARALARAEVERAKTREP